MSLSLVKGTVLSGLQWQLVGGEGLPGYQVVPGTTWSLNKGITGLLKVTV